MQDRAAKTRRRLISSAAEVFNRSGFAGSSIGQICAHAGTSHGALYFHFGNKRVLGQAVEAAAAEILLCVTGPVPARHPEPLRLLVDTSHVLAERVARDQVLRAGFGLARDAAWDSGAGLWRHWREWVGGLLATAGRQGALAPDVDLDDAVAAIMAVMAGLGGMQGTPGADRVDGDARPLAPFWRLVLPQLAAEAVRGGIDAAGSPPAPTLEPPSGRRRSDDGPAPHECVALADGRPCRAPHGDYRKMCGSAS